MRKKPKKVLVLGSGAIRIGQAGEFDYSGSQCLKALKEEGISVVLVNPNIATIQTSRELADKTYFLPVTPYFVEEVIKKERPQGIMLAFGGQTALNCGVELYRKGVLRKHKVEVLGTGVESIIATEDREIFAEKLREIGVKTPKSFAVRRISEALEAAERISYPVMVRAAFALGGKGSGIAYNRNELEEIAAKALSDVPQILVEEFLGGWKEVEYEVVRDSHGNCITVCNMENFDPLGIHTGESIVVAPSQTLTDFEYHSLRRISIDVIRHLNVIGECNIQFALSPDSFDYRVIEVNARLSRSSALASKATGYPLAFVAAKLALGKSLTELPNAITKKTMACFEPALDYVVVKIPRWDLDKFRRVSRRIGSEMKSVGEVMAIGRKFEEALQKAVRMLGQGMAGIVCNSISFEDLEGELSRPTDKRVFAVAEALGKGVGVERISELSGIDKWFIHKINNVVSTASELSERGLDKGLIARAKRQGFSDRQIALLAKKSEDEVFSLRKRLGIRPFVKQIDTLAAEYPARTNYLYLTYNAEESDVESSRRSSVMVLGSGAYRIGSSVEFDWCAVNAVLELRKMGYEAIMVNFNPETVSTDYDVCDRLYFDELSFEVVREIYEFEKPEGVVLSVGGQIPNNIAMECRKNGVRVIGTSPESIDSAEDRHKFSALLDRLGIDQPEWRELTSLEEARAFASKAGYPVMIRPSYVLSGSAMAVAFSEKDLEKYLTKAADVSKEHPVVLSKFITNAREIEMDAVAKNGRIVVYAISEHIENAGVHSGDATMVFPPQRTYIETIRRIKIATERIAASLRITGPFNIQFIAKDNRLKVIECNLRASRSFPFVSKVSGVNFVRAATRAMMGKRVPLGKTTLDLAWVGVKAPQFSYSRLKGADPILSVEMNSTGEVACLGDTIEEAFLKAIMATGMRLPEKNVLLSLGGERNKVEFLEWAAKLRDAGFRLFATEHTAEFLRKHGITAEMVYKAHNLHKKNNVIDMMRNRGIELVINIPDDFNAASIGDDYHIRRSAVDYSVPLLTNLQLAKLFIDSILRLKKRDLAVKAWEEYV